MDAIYQWISDTFNIELKVAEYVFYGVVAIVALAIIVLIVVLCVHFSKKKKRKSLANKETNEVIETKPEPEVTPVEIKEEPKVTEAKVVEEKTSPLPPKEEEKPVETEKKVNTSSTNAKKKEPVKKEAVKKTQPKKTETKKKVVKEEEETPVTPFKGEPKKNLGKFTISQEGPNFRYRLKASNGELLVVSELYASELSARNGIETIKKNADSETIDFIEDKHGLFSFRVMTKQGRCLASSANYKTNARAISASESFKKFVITEKIELEDASDHFEVEEFKKDINPEEKGKYRISAQDDGFVYQLFASNGRVIATSQIYKSEASCKDGLEKFRTLAYEGDFFIFKDKNDKYQFKLYNKQKRLVLAGEVYDSKDRVVSAIESIKRFAKLAIIDSSEVTE